MEKFKSRARASYEAGDISYIEVLLTSKDLSEMMTKVDLITEVAEYDRNLLKKLKSEISIIEELRNDIAQQTNEQKEAVDSLASAKSRQQSQINQIDSAISDLKSDEASLIAEQEKYDKLEEALDKKISSLASTSTSYSGDELCWPVPGYSRISSGYGWRTLYGKRNFHSAIDIPAPKGTPIVAAEAGTVIYAQWTDTGGGYKIVIDHGSQLVTHYNHMSSFAVSKGDKVKKGQVIGYVGSTGNSTGNHLDFKIIYKGETYNPSLYVNPSNSKPQKSIHSLIG